MPQPGQERFLVLSIKREFEKGVIDGNSQQKDEPEGELYLRLRPDFVKHIFFVCGFSAALWMKTFNDMAAMVRMIEQLWWKHHYELQHMTGQRCRQIGKAAKNLAARIIAPY